MRRVRLVMVPLVLVLVACLGMRPALADWNDGGAWNVDDADMGIKWGPTSVGGDRKGFVMVSDNRFNACLMVCGISINDERLTADAKAKLSNSDTGGGFYLLAQRFGQYGDGNLPDWAKPSLDMGSITANSAIRTCAAMYGADATWWGDYTELERTNALRDLVEILNGGNVGGDVGGPVVDGYYVFHGNTHYMEFSGGGGAPQWYLLDGSNKISNRVDSRTGWQMLPTQLTVRVPANLVTQLETLYPHDTNTWVLSLGSSYQSQSLYTGQVQSFTIFVNPRGRVTSTSSTYVAHTFYSSITGADYLYTKYFKYDGQATGTTYSNGVITIPSSFSKSYTTSNVGSVGVYGFSPVNFYDMDTVHIPPTQWPDSPTYEPPTAPVVPDPVEPTIPSEPSAPTPVEPVQPDSPAPGQNPVFISQPTYVENTYTADLQGILDALNEHCIHLQNALYANISDLYNKLSTKLTNDLSNLKSFLHGEFGWLNDARHNDIVSTWDYLQDLFSWLGGLISDNFSSLNLHLTQLFNWLAEQFDFSFTGTGYNDDTVVSWLKKIYSKLGTGMNTRPNDPVAEPDSFGDWLNRLLQNFVLDLLAVGQDALADLVENFRQLITKFPFSLPWDIAALLGLLVAEPVAPAFDFPLYTVADGGIHQAATCHISLEDYNDAWEGVRFIEKVGFAVFLAWNATHFRRYFDGAGKEQS